MAFMGFFNVYALRVNLSIAIVAMTTGKEVTLGNGTTIQVRGEEGEGVLTLRGWRSSLIPSTDFRQVAADFDWDSQTRGLILSSFFWGYLVTQVPGGWLAARVGGTRVYGMGLAATALLTVFTPPLAKAGLGWLIAVRVIEGLFEVSLARRSYSLSKVRTTKCV